MSGTTFDRSRMLAVVVDDAGLFAAGRAEADELHERFPLNGRFE